MKNITMADIAAECGVSKRSVSAAINPRPDSGVRVGKATAQKIREVAHRLGYKPNRTASQFFQRRHGAVGILLRWIEEIPYDTLGQIIRDARKEGLVVLIEEFPDKADKLPHLLREDSVDGLVVVSGYSERIGEEIVQLEIPVVELNTGNRSVPLSINHDEKDGCRKIIESFADLGRKQPLFVLPQNRSEHYSQVEREHWLRHYAEESGMRPLVVTRLGEPPWDGIQEAAFRENPEIDCVVLYTDRIAPSFCRVVRRLGLEVPDRVSAVCYNNTLAAMSTFPSMTAMGVPAEKVSRALLSTLTEAINGGPRNLEPLELKYQMYERDSTAEPGMNADQYYAFEKDEVRL